MGMLTGISALRRSMVPMLFRDACFYADFAAWPTLDNCCLIGAAGGQSLSAALARSSTATYTDQTGKIQSAGNNVARFNYDAALNSQGLYLEDSRTNKLLYSHDWTQTAWVKVTMANALNATGPDGVANSATTLTATSALATALQTYTAASTAASFSVYIKRVTGTGTVKITRDGTTYTDVTSSINSSTWTRVSIVNTSVTNPNCGIQLGTMNDAVVVWGAQDEQAICVSSVIPTTTAAVTRSQDQFILSGAVNFQAVITQASFMSLFAEGQTFDTTLGTECAISVDDNSTANRHMLRHSSTASSASMVVASGGTVQSSIGTGPNWPVSTRTKAASSFSPAAGTNLSVANSQQVQSTAGPLTAPVYTNLRLTMGSVNVVANFFGALARAAVFPRALTGPEILNLVDS